MMNDNEIYAKLDALFQEFFHAPTIRLTPTSTTANIPQWDSMNHVQLILKVEQLFDIRFKHAEIAAFDNVGDMVAAISRRIQQSQ
jgi:acyl carrier protein